MIYGAYGYTGKLLVEEATRLGEKPILAGRKPQKLEELATKYNLKFCEFTLGDIDEIARKIETVDLVLNVAGPFTNTADNFIKACIKTATHYLDITGEIAIFEKNWNYDDIAREKGIAIISGVGFDVVPSDCLAVYTSKKIKSPVSLELGIHAASTYSPGTMKTTIQNIPNGSVIRKEGKIIPIKLAGDCKEIKFTNGNYKLCTIAWGDIATAYKSTQIPNIKVYMSLPSKIRKLVKIFGFIIKPLFKMKWVQKVAKKWAGEHIKGPDEQMRNNNRSYLWCKVENSEGQIGEAWLETVEAYRLTAITGIKAVLEIIGKPKQNAIVGALTPAEAFGEDFILEVPETSRYDELNEVS